MRTPGFLIHSPTAVMLVMVVSVNSTLLINIKSTSAVQVLPYISRCFIMEKRVSVKETYSRVISIVKVLT